MSKRLPPKLAYTHQEVHDLLCSYETETQQWVISTFPNQIGELAVLEKQIREAIPEENESAIFLVPLVYPDGHMAGIIFRKSPDETIKMFYFDPIGPQEDCKLLPAEKKDFTDIIHNIFPDKEVEFHDMVFPIGPAKIGDSPAIVVQALHDMARAWERNPDLVNRSQLHSESQMGRFHYGEGEIAKVQSQHAAGRVVPAPDSLARKRKTEDEARPGKGVRLQGRRKFAGEEEVKYTGERSS